MASSKNRPPLVLLNPGKPDLYNASADREKNYLGRKIAEARKESGMSLSAFKAVLDDYGVHVNVGAINKWELGHSAPNAYQLLAIGSALGLEEDFTYFMSTSSRKQLNREGLLKVASYRDDLIASGHYKPQGDADDLIHYKDMPVSCLSASAGTGQFLDEGNYEMVSFPEASIPEGAEFGIRIAGDSMEPVYHDGHIVWVQQCDSLRIGEVGIFIYDNEGYIKVYNEQMPSEENLEAYTDSYGGVHMQPVLISYNKKYPPREVSASANFQIVGRVL